MSLSILIPETVIQYNFHPLEFRCRCGRCRWSTSPVVDFRLLIALQTVRDSFLDCDSLYITSGNRCLEYNMTFPNSGPYSAHLFGTGADFQVWIRGKQVAPKTVYDFCDVCWLERYGIGVYDHHIHLDVRETKKRWDNRTGGR